MVETPRGLREAAVMEARGSNGWTLEGYLNPRCVLWRPVLTEALGKVSICSPLFLTSYAQRVRVRSGRREQGGRWLRGHGAP